MFDKIITSLDPYRGPAQGHSGGEHGDNWNDAVKKINAGFEKVKALFEGVGVGDNSEFVKRSDVEEIVHGLMMTHEMRIRALEEFFTAGVQGVPATGGEGKAPGPNGEGNPNAPQEAKPSDPGYVAPPQHEPGA